MIFRPSWPDSRWLRLARTGGAAQAVAPALDLREADEVSCRNERTRRDLVASGFAPDRVVVRRASFASMA